MQLPGKRGITEEKGWDKSSLTNSCHSISCCSVLTLSLEQHRRYLSVVKGEGEVMQEDSIEENGWVRDSSFICLYLRSSHKMMRWSLRKELGLAGSLKWKGTVLLSIVGLFVLLIASYSCGRCWGERNERLFLWCSEYTCSVLCRFSAASLPSNN